MQRVIIIPESEWQGLVLKQQQLEKEVSYLKKGLSTWVNTAEAERLTGLKRKALDKRRQDGTWAQGTDWKNEGAKVLYSRTSLEAYNDSARPRRRKYDLSIANLRP